MAHSPSRRVLVVEDDRDSAEALILLLQLIGCEGQWVPNGAETLRTFAALRLRGEPYPDLVLIDLSLPDMDGLALGKALHEDSSMCPLVLVSAASEHALRAASDEIGAFAVLRKPFALDQLRDLFTRLRLRTRVTA